MSHIPGSRELWPLGTECQPRGGGGKPDPTMEWERDYSSELRALLPETQPAPLPAATGSRCSLPLCGR